MHGFMEILIIFFFMQVYIYKKTQDRPYTHWSSQKGPTQEWIPRSQVKGTTHYNWAMALGHGNLRIKIGCFLYEKLSFSCIGR